MRIVDLTHPFHVGMPKFPGLPEPSFAHIATVAQDGPSAHPVDRTTYDLHRMSLSSGRMVIEDVANLDQLPARSRVTVAPLKAPRGQRRARSNPGHGPGRVDLTGAH